MHFINNDGPRPIDVIAPETEYIDSTTLRVMTPDFMQLGPKDCVIHIAINEGDLSVTSTKFL